MRRLVVVCGVLILLGAVGVRIANGSHFVIEHPANLVSGKWVKVNLHIHTAVSGGSRNACQTAQAYTGSEYAAIVLSDKTEDIGTGPVTPDPGPSCDTANGNSMLVIPGYEDTQPGGTGTHHLTIANVSQINTSASNTSRQAAITYARQHPASLAGVYISFAHPTFSTNDWTASEIEALQGANALEVWNGQGYDSDSVYDAVLTAGMKIWADAADDSYTAGGDNLGWDVVNVTSVAVDAILSGLQNGRFYATESPGHAIRCSSTSQSITCSAYLAEPPTTPFVGTFQWISRNGAIVRSTLNASTDTYTITGGEGYVRLVFSDSYGYGKVWSQPFFIKPL